MHWTGKVQPVAFTIFGRDIAWYGIIITTAMLIGLITAILLAKKTKLKSDDLLEAFLIDIPMAIIFARLGYVIVRPYEYYVIEGFDFEDFINIFAVWDGGLTIITGAPGGILGAYLWSRWRKVDFIRLADTIICVMLLSQALGRWGNFFNQEIYGAEITNPKWQFFPAAVYIAREGGFYQATFFYEMVLNLIGFGIMLYISRRLLVRGHGIPLYAITYGTIRFILEFMRDDGDLYEVVNFTQIILGVVVAASIAILVYLIMREKKKGNRIWYAKGIPDKLIKPVKYAIYKEGKTDY
jgi:phosphatidylglycerol:prolipoprotein diacylglycerol transferase